MVKRQTITEAKSISAVLERIARYVALSEYYVSHTDVRVCQSFTHGYNPKQLPAFGDEWHTRARRMSHDEKSITTPRRFLIDVEETIRVVLEQEDTDGDFQISITDAGPKLMALGTATSNGFKSFDIRVRQV